MSKTSETLHEAIQRLAEQGIPYAAICKRLGVSRTTVWRVLRAK